VRSVTLALSRMCEGSDGRAGDSPCQSLAAGDGF
jgi:hypothetical protein